MVYFHTIGHRPMSIQSIQTKYKSNDKWHSHTYLSIQVQIMRRNDITLLIIKRIVSYFKTFVDKHG